MTNVHTNKWVGGALPVVLSYSVQVVDRSQNYELHFICTTFHLHYISFAFKNHAMSA